MVIAAFTELLLFINSILVFALRILVLLVLLACIVIFMNYILS